MKTARPNKDLKSAHITPADGNVFADLGFSPKQAKAMLADADAQIAKSQTTRKPAKPTTKFALSADAYLRSDPANEKAVTEAIKAAECGELVAFDPRRR